MDAAGFSFGAIVLLIAIALAFDFLNGFHDAANSIATIVSTRVLRPHYAVAWAAFFNFVAFLVFGLHVANSIGTGVIIPSIVDHYVILGALLGAIVWNVVTWYYGIPSSSSHALIGGLAGAAGAKARYAAPMGQGFLGLTPAISAAPIFAGSAPTRIDRWFRRLQFVSASMYSLGHGGNDAQKTMGIIAMVVFSSGMSGPTFHVPFWVVLSCQAVIALGTLFGGWRIVKTMGMRITKLKPVGGFCAETGGAITLFIATGFGIPVSTTHTITGAIIGVGATRKLSAVRWGVAEQIVWAWVLTIPCSAFIAAIAWWL